MAYLAPCASVKALSTQRTLRKLLQSYVDSLIIMCHYVRVSPEGAAEPGAAGAAGAGRGQQPPGEVVAEAQQLRPHRQRRGLHLRPLLTH